MSQIEWKFWTELNWLSPTDERGTALHYCDRLMEIAMQSGNQNEFLSKLLPEISAECGAQWVAVVQRCPNWLVLDACGRNPTETLPNHFLDEAIDRGAAGYQQPQEDQWPMLVVPLPDGVYQGSALMLVGRRISPQDLPLAMVVGRMMGYSLAILDSQRRRDTDTQRLTQLLEVASEFASTRETKPLLELIANKATQLLDCDRASIFVWDRDNKQVVGCPALGVNELRLPDNKGIVGEVIHARKSIRVDDVNTDTRFNKKVDKESGYETRNLLCCPLTDQAEKLIGAFEVINKNKGVFSADDEDSLHQLAVHAGIALENARQREQLVRSHQQLTSQLTQNVEIIGESPAIQALQGTIDRLAGTDLPVLVTGESGTGKEVVSQSLHYKGPRAGYPFVAVNCAALTETLLESELFGHEKGAFTGADQTHAGKFELADGGTLFLDEIGDMSLNGQAKLLRVLEQKVITRVGGTTTIPVNVRVIAATNRNLAEAAREKTFREDLYFRLSVVTLELPSLRERPEDIIPLAEHFLGRFSVQAGRAQMHFTQDALRRLQAHNWPGNVRELRNLMERIAFLTTSEQVEADDLEFILNPDSESALEPSIELGLEQGTKQFQREFIRLAVKRVSGNMSEAAKLLGLHRSNLYRKMRQLEMNEVGGLE